MSKYKCNCTGKEKIGESERTVFIPRYPDMEATIEHMEKDKMRADGWDGILIDVCLVNEIKNLWSKGIITTGCCCGHNQIDPYIGVIEEHIPLMKKMGYVVSPNKSRPGAENSFFPKSLIKRRTLHLNLKRKWFDMIISGDKKEEYRDITPYWYKRFESMLCDFALSGYDSITFSNGYAKNRPQFKIELKGIYIRGGKEKWGAEPCKGYYVLKLGKIISKTNC